MSENTIARYFLKAEIIPRAVQGELEGVFSKVGVFKKMENR